MKDIEDGASKEAQRALSSTGPKSEDQEVLDARPTLVDVLDLGDRGKSVLAALFAALRGNDVYQAFPADMGSSPKDRKNESQ